MSRELKTPKKLTKSVIALSLIVPLLAGCANASLENSFCDIYIPVYNYDTPQVPEDIKKQIDANNAVWWKDCN